jgi:hypothetical protein
MGTLANPATPIAEFHDSAVPLEPTHLRAGDSWNWTRAFPNYPSAAYTLTYILNSPTHRFVFPAAAITPDKDSQSFDIQLSPTQTGPCPADTYDFVAVLTQAASAGDGQIPQQVTLVLQSVLIEANLATATGPVDTRSFVKRTLDMIRAAILGDARPDVQEYMIQGRQLRKIPRKELETLLASYEYRYKAELRARGEYTPSKSPGFRFTTSV